MPNPTAPKDALNHGFYATGAVLYDENQTEYDELLRDLRDEYCPEGRSEEEAVIDLTNLYWKKRRAEASFKQGLLKLRDLKAAANRRRVRLDDLIKDQLKTQTAAANFVGKNLSDQTDILLKGDPAETTLMRYEFEKLRVALQEYLVVSDDLARIVGLKNTSSIKSPSISVRTF